MVDGYCNQPLRATVDTETLAGPGDVRFQLQPTGVARLVMPRSPVTQIVSAQYAAAASFPRNWQTIPASQLAPEKPLLGVYGSTAPGSAADSGGQAVLLAPGYADWGFGRGSTLVQVTYVNGWPHGALTANASAGASSIQVDDCTGWNGAVATVFDAGNEEPISVTSASATSGPGTLSLASPLTYAHNAGTLVTTLPEQVMWATILFATAQALTRGATATAVQGARGSAGGGGRDAEALVEEAELLIHPFRRVV